jgi:hypothetical protein
VTKCCQGYQQTKMGVACSTHLRDEVRSVYNFKSQEPEGKRPLDRCMHRLENNIETDLNKEIQF